jgi:hypothetical protein
LGAPLGNQNAAKAKVWRAAIERALERLADPSINPDYPIARSPRAKGLDMMAEQFVRNCLADSTTVPSLRDLGDRIDGKPVQATEISGPDGGDIPFKGFVIEYGRGGTQNGPADPQT